MKLRFLIIPITAFCMISSCSSCGEGKNNGSSNEGDYTNSNEITTNALSQSEQIQQDMTAMITEQVQLSKDSKSKRVETMIAGFELGMTKREVKKHMLRMKQKKHLVRVKKSSKVYEYVYQLKLESGKSNTYMDFEYSQKGGVYKAICKPSKFRKKSKSNFLAEVHQLLTEWYGPHNFQLPNHKNCARYIWISGNRHIDLYCTSKGVEFVYTDLTIEVPKVVVEQPSSDVPL